MMPWMPESDHLALLKALPCPHAKEKSKPLHCLHGSAPLLSPSFNSRLSNSRPSLRPLRPHWPQGLCPTHPFQISSLVAAGLKPSSLPVFAQRCFSPRQTLATSVQITQGTLAPSAPDLEKGKTLSFTCLFMACLPH